MCVLDLTCLCTEARGRVSPPRAQQLLWHLSTALHGLRTRLAVLAETVDDEAPFVSIPHAEWQRLLAEVQLYPAPYRVPEVTHVPA